MRIDRDHRYFKIDNKNLIFPCFDLILTINYNISRIFMIIHTMYKIFI